jgi:tetratricopeptide (TPR) repeat protein
MLKRTANLFSVLLLLPFFAAAQNPAELAEKAIAAGNLAEAKSVLDAALAKEPGNYEYLWRYSRLMILTGESRTGQKDELDFYTKALEWAEKAVKANKKGSAGYVRRAAANGKLALFQGVLTSNTYVNSAKEDVERAIKNKADGDLTLAAAYYILGRSNLKLSETPVVLRMPLDLDWGNVDDAVSNLKKAVELRPGFVMYHLELGRAYIAQENNAKAKEQLSLAANGSEQEPGDAKRRQEAAELLKSL